MQVIKSSTNLVWVLGRTQTNTPADYANVHAIQKGFNLVPLSAWGRAEASIPSPAVVPPRMGETQSDAPAQVPGMDADTFLKPSPPYSRTIRPMLKMLLL